MFLSFLQSYASKPTFLRRVLVPVGQLLDVWLHLRVGFFACDTADGGQVEMERYVVERGEDAHVDVQYWR